MSNMTYNGLALIDDTYFSRIILESPQPLLNLLFLFQFSCYINITLVISIDSLYSLQDLFLGFYISALLWLCFQLLNLWIAFI